MTEGRIGPNDLARLCRLLGVEVGEVLVEPLSGGLSNRSFRLSHGAGSWAARLPLETGERLSQTLDGVTEERLLRAVAHAGLTPDVVLYDPGTGALITEYVENAVPWTTDTARHPENLCRIAVTLRSLHGVTVSHELNPFRPVVLADEYLTSARRAMRDEERTFSAEDKRWEVELRRLAGVYEASFPATVLCHHDLVAANILDAGKIWLVDFEYALLAHPILDLASLAAMNDHDAPERALLSEAYFGAEPVPFRREELDEVIRLERLLSYFWAVSRRNDSTPAGELSRFADFMAAMLR